jgi:DNA helicase HerA-like ATPase
MSDAALGFNNADLLGRVSAVDTHRVSISVENPELLTRVGVGNLLAIRGATEREYLIAIVERVLRSLQQSMPDLSGDALEVELGISATDHVRAALIGTYRSVDGEKSNTFKRGADSFPQIDREVFAIESGNLQRFMGLLGSAYDEEEKLKLGRFVADPTAEAIASGDKLFQRHAAILGSIGSGKSWAVALLLERAAQLKFPNIIVFDMHGEYQPLADSSKGGFASRFKIAGPGDLDKPNDDVLFLPYWMLNNEEMLSMILDRSDQNAPNQASRFRLHVRDLKKKTLSVVGDKEVERTFTVDSPVPYDMKALLKLVHTDNTTKGQGKTGPVKGPWEDKLTRFIARLESKLDDRRYGFMFQPPEAASSYDWLSEQAWQLLRSGDAPGVKIVDFSEVPSDILPIVAGTLARFLYDIQFWLDAEKRTPVTILCDEAHLYLPVRDDADAVERQALAAFERIAKEGRKYGVSIVVVSQRPSDISRTILSQCNNFIALRLTNDTDQGVIRRLVPDQLSDLTSILPLLDVGEILLLGDAVLLPTRIKLDKPTVQPSSATRDFWQEWATMEPDADAIKKAVRSLRGQTRAPKV